MYREKQTKNIITKESIAQELLRERQHSLRLYILFSVALTVFVGLVFWAIYSFGMRGKSVSTIGYVIYVLTLLISLTPSALLLWPIPAIKKGQERLKNGAFLVVTDEAVYKAARTATRRGHNYEEKIVHFYKYGDVPMAGGTWYQLTDKGDVYYMVVYDENDIAPLAYYPAKLYEYKK